MLGFARGPDGRFFIKDATNVTAFDGTMDDGGGAGKFCKAAAGAEIYLLRDSVIDI